MLDGEVLSASRAIAATPLDPGASRSRLLQCARAGAHGL